jgi:hypothetical protein
MKNNADPKFEMGDRISFVLPSGKIEEGVVKAVFETTAGPRLNVAFGAKGDLSASVGIRQVIRKLPPLIDRRDKWKCRNKDR